MVCVAVAMYHVECILCELMEPHHEDKLDLHYSSEFNLDKQLTHVHHIQPVLSRDYYPLLQCFKVLKILLLSKPMRLIKASAIPSAGHGGIIHLNKSQLVINDVFER